MNMNKNISDFQSEAVLMVNSMFVVGSIRCQMLNFCDKKIVIGALYRPIMVCRYLSGIGVCRSLSLNACVLPWCR